MSSGWILIADDHPLTREGMFLAARSARPGANVVAVGSVAEAATELDRRPGCAMIMLDFHLPDARGYSGLLQLQHQAPDVPIVIVTVREDPSLVEAAKALSAVAYVFKSRPLDEIAAILRLVLIGQTHFPSGVAISPVISAARARIADLSPAQHKVLLALADGHSNKQIAHDLHVTEATVKAHLTAVFRKLGVTNRAQALLAMQPLLQAGEADVPA